MVHDRVTLLPGDVEVCGGSSRTNLDLKDLMVDCSTFSDLKNFIETKAMIYDCYMIAA